MPTRANNKHEYFDDTYQCLPTNGCTSFFKNMFRYDNVESHLNTDYFDIQHHFQKNFTDQAHLRILLIIIIHI